MAHARVWLAIALAWSVAGCQADSHTELPVGDHVFVVEIAETPEERRRGLMFRTELGPDEGMLFVFPEAGLRSFWMKDTRVPLSIAYADSRGRILEIYDMEPLSETPVRSRYPAKYALEVNQSRFADVGITVGDRIDVSAVDWVSPR